MEIPQSGWIMDGSDFWVHILTNFMRVLLITGVD